MSLRGQRTTTSSMDWEDFRSFVLKLERDGEFKMCLISAICGFMGLRIGDVLRLQFEDFTGEVLELTERKTGKQRRIKINSDLRAIIERIREKMGRNGGLIFLNRFGTKTIDRSYVNVKLKQLLKKYNISVSGNPSSHMFRKTLGNKVLRNYNYAPEAIYLLMDLFSHSSPAMTKKYLGLREKDIFDALESLSL
jgi:integrase